MFTDGLNVLGCGLLPAGSSKDPLRAILPAASGILFGVEALGHVDGDMIAFEDAAARKAANWKLDQLNSGVSTFAGVAAAAGLGPFLRLIADAVAHHGGQVRGDLDGTTVLGRFFPDTARPIWAKFRFRVSASDSAWLIGFGTAGSTTSLSGADALGLADFIGFYCLSGGTIVAHVRTGSASTTLNMTQAFATATWFDAGIYVDAKNSVTFALSAAGTVPNAQQFQTTMTNLPQVAMVPFAALTSPAGAGANFDLLRQYWAQLAKP